MTTHSGQGQKGRNDRTCLSLVCYSHELVTRAFPTRVIQSVVPYATLLVTVFEAAVANVGQKQGDQK